VDPVAWNVSSPGVGGSIYDGVRSAAILDVATTRPVSTRPRTPTRQVTPSSAVSSRTRIGFGITEQTNTWKGLTWHPRNIILWTNLCLDRRDRSPPTGKTFWWNRDAPLVAGPVEVPNSSGRVEHGPRRVQSNTVAER
jgi:hypothetical protein